MSMEPPGPPPPPPPPDPYPYASPPPEQPAGAPGYAPPVYQAPPRRGRGPLLAIGLVVLLIVVALGAYGVGGFVYAQSRLNSANNAYNTVVDHQNKLNAFFGNLSKQFNNSDPTSATPDAVKQERTLLQQLITQSQAAQPQVSSDDESLAAADAKLHENEWLTGLSRSSINSQSTRIADARAALGVAKTVLADYIQFGGFFDLLDACALDLDTLGTTAQAKDFVGAANAVQALKTDVAKAIPLDKAPGLAPEMDTFMQDLKALANDFDTLLKAAAAGDVSGTNTAIKAVDADTAKLDAFDFTAMDTAAQTFYQGLIDKYNADIDKANKD